MAKEAAERWNINDPKTLKSYYPKSKGWQTERHLKSRQQRRVREALKRLEFYRNLEVKLNSPIETADIVRQLQFLVILAADYYKTIPPSVNDRLEKHFSDEQRKVLHSILIDVIGKLRLRGGRGGIFTEEAFLVGNGI